MSARRPVRRPSWAPEEPPGGGLGRQEARLQAVLAVRRPECRFYCSFAAKCRFCAGGSLEAPPAKSPRCQRVIAEFLYRYLNFIFFQIWGGEGIEFSYAQGSFSLLTYRTFCTRWGLRPHWIAEHLWDNVRGGGSETPWNCVRTVIVS